MLRIKNILKKDKKNTNHNRNQSLVDAPRDSVGEVKRSLESANLIFLDQFGIKYVNNERFQTLIGLPVTDILFFISSATFNRFRNDKNVTDVIGVHCDEIDNCHFYEIHRLVHKKYSELIPKENSYCLAPFSIMKGTNIYGLIFGSAHPLAMEKFLNICWDRDAETGEANFDIQGDKQRKIQPSLFDEDNRNSKIKVFQTELLRKVLNGELTNDKEIFLYGINNGFTARHIRPVITNLKENNKIQIRQPAFTCSTVWNYRRDPKKIVIL